MYVFLILLYNWNTFLATLWTTHRHTVVALLLGFLSLDFSLFSLTHWYLCATNNATVLRNWLLHTPKAHTEMRQSAVWQLHRRALAAVRARRAVPQSGAFASVCACDERTQLALADSWRQSAVRLQYPTNETRFSNIQKLRVKVDVKEVSSCRTFDNEGFKKRQKNRIDGSCQIVYIW